MTTQEPQTEAGRRLVDWFGGPMRPGEKRNLSAAILDIERQAAALALAEVAGRAKMEHDKVCACPGDDTDPDCHSPCSGALVALLALLEDR